jgi:pilus assembly protein CpaE
MTATAIVPGHDDPSLAGPAVGDLAVIDAGVPDTSDGRPGASKPVRILVLDRSEDLALQVKRAVGDAALTGVGAHAAAPEIVPCTQMSHVAQLLEDEGPFALMLAGPSAGTRTGLARVELIRHAYPLMSVVLAFDQRPDARLRDVLRAGAIDLLELPAEDAEVVDCVGRALDLHRGALEAAPRPAPIVKVIAAPGTESGVVASRLPGKVFTVASATGGCGKTFMATNLAYFLRAHSPDDRVCLLDLDLQFGEVSSALRMRPRYTIFDLLERERSGTGADDLEEHIEDYLSPHEAGFHVLAAPKDPIEADRIRPPDVVRIIEALRRRFEYVIVDTPGQLADVVTVTLDLSELLIVMTTLDLPSVRNMSVFLSTLERLKIPTEAVRLVLNKAETDVGIDIAQVEKLFPQGFMAVLPYAKEVSRSINLGVPVMASAPAAEVSRRMDKAMVQLLRPEMRAVADARPTRKRRLFGRRQS